MLGLLVDFVQRALEQPRYWWSVVLLLAAGIYFAVAATKLWKIDLKTHRLPDKIVLPLYAGIGLPLFGIYWLEGDIPGANKMGWSAIFLFGLYWIMRLASRRSLGFGDVKLAGALGLLMAFFSPWNVWWGTLLAFLSGTLQGLYLHFYKKQSLKTHIPFGPHMILGASIAALFPIVSVW